MNPILRKLRWLTERRRKENELSEELRFHLEEEAEERQAAGLAEESARRDARRDLGNLTLVEENTRAAWTWMYLEQLLQDLRYAVRAMAANKTFSTLAILSLALGIGANTAIYSFMDSILLRSLPVANTDSLVVVNWHTRIAPGPTVMHGFSGNSYTDPKTGTTAGIFPFPAFELLHKSEGVFASVFAFYPTRAVNVMVKGQAEQSSGEYVSGDYFQGLGVLPAAGRLIIPDDDRAGAPALVILSYKFSQKHFDDAASAPGQSILINNLPFMVAGVAPPGFFGVDPAAVPDFFIPMHANILLNTRGGPGGGAKAYLAQNYYWIEMMGRLGPGVSLAQAQAALGPVFHRWVDSTANDEERANLPTLLLREGAGGVDRLRRAYAEPLYVLLAMVGLILAIACSNIANLLLARATARRREMAVRLSMGAGRFRVVRQLLTESLLLASAGGVLGIGFAVWGIRSLRLLLANGNADFPVNPSLNWHVLGVALGLSIVTGLLFGMAPALQATRADVMPALKQARAGQSGSGRSHRGAGVSRVLVVCQIGISLLMLVAAGLFARTLSNLQSIELGFRPDNLLLFQMNARQAGHRDPEILAFYSDLLERFRAIPGVTKASVTHYPMIGKGTWMEPVIPAGEHPNIDVTTHVLMTGSEFFSTMQIPVLLGRAIDERDRPGSQPVAVVNQEYAKIYFGERNPLGRHIVINQGPQTAKDVEIVGVVRNARYGDLKGDFEPVVYLPFNQDSYVRVDEMTFALRTSGNPLAHAGRVRAIVHEADPRVPVTNIKTEAAQIDQTMNQEIIFARLCTGFAILALAIVCVGLYGSMSYTVARRTGEIGIRMTLGAQRGAVVWMVLREVLTMAAVGLAISVPSALGASKLVESFLFGVRPNDPRALVMAVAILLGAAVMAGYVPARKASRIDPMTAIRHE